MIRNSIRYTIILNLIKRIGGTTVFYLGILFWLTWWFRYPINGKYMPFFL